MAMSFSHLFVLVTLIYLGVFSGSTVAWYWWTPTPPQFPGNTWGWNSPDGCQDVENYYRSCEYYIVGTDQYPQPECCSGLAYLNQIARSQPGGASQICQCIEAVAARGGHPQYDERRIENLYYSCNIHLSFPISEHMDCSRV